MSTYAANLIDPEIDALAKQAGEALVLAQQMEQRAKSAEAQLQALQSRGPEVVLEKVAAEPVHHRQANRIAQLLSDRQIIDEDYIQKMASTLVEGPFAALDQLERIISIVPAVSQERGTGVEKQAGKRPAVPKEDLSLWLETPAGS